MSRRTFILRLSSFVLLLGVIAAAAAYGWLVTDLPSLDRLTENLAVPSTKVLARDGRLLFEITDPAGVHHTTVPLNEIPLALQQATIATEDASFYSNPGVDIVGIVRAVWINLTGGEVLAGGSTLTQQVARNMLLDPQERAERTLTRKLRESILAWRLSRAYSKHDILALYLNQTYYGHLAYGVEAAARTFFGKSVRDLDVSESALLAGLPQAPSLYDPLLYPDDARARQAVVLDLMVRQGYLTEDAARLAKAEELQWSAAAFPIEAPHFVFYVWNLLERRYGPEVLYSGLTVQTTLDLDLTREAQAIAERRLAQLADRDGPPANATGAALIALDPRTGQILAMLGSPDYFSDENSGALNMALSPRQPGSAIKPLTYAAAFSPEYCGTARATTDDRRPTTASSTDEGRTTNDEGGLPDLRLLTSDLHLSPLSFVLGPSSFVLPSALGRRSSVIGRPAAPLCPWTAATMILDVRTAFVTKEGFSYVPQNYDRAYHGPVSAREALAGSLNLPAVLTLDHIGLPTLLGLAGRMGLTTLSEADRYDLSLTLGGGEVRLLDLTAAFGAFANGGVRVEPYPILKIETAAGEVIEQWRPPAGAQVVDERVAFLISDILSDNNARAATFGFNSVLQIGRPAAVKTGTTTDYRDNWTVGYTPDLVTGVWVGNPNNTPMVSLGGVSGAGPIWHDFMRAALAGKPEARFEPPDGLERATVCLPSGWLPTEICPRTRSEWFLAGTAPTLYDDLYQQFAIDTRTGGLAVTATPAEFITQQVFLVLPPEAQEWARQNGIPQPPEGMAAGPGEPSAPLSLIAPDPNTVYVISPRLPLESQLIPFRVAVGGATRSVTYFVDGVEFETVTSAPFEAWWQLAPGTHQLRAEARLEGGEVVTSEAIEFSVTR